MLPSDNHAELLMSSPLSLLELDLLRTFVTVADNRSFTRAAERIGLNQSTVSLQIKKLEGGLGRRVFDRAGRDIKLTPDGEILLEYAREMLRLGEEACARILESDVEGVVRLGTTEDFGTTYLPQVLARFARSHPGVSLEVSCNFSFSLLDGFSKGEYDIVLVKREPQGPTGGVPVWKDDLVWVIGPDLDLVSNKPIPLALAPAPDVYRKRALGALDAVKRRWRIVFTSPSMEGLQAAVRAGLGVTVLSKDMVPPGLYMLRTEHGLPKLPDAEIAMYCAPGVLSKAAKLLAEHIIHSLEIRPPAAVTRS